MWMCVLASVEALGRLGDLRALGPVRKLLEWEDDRLAQVERAQVVIALFRLGDDDAGRRFVELLRDDDLEVRDMAWDALDDLGNASSKSLIRMIENDNERIRTAAIAHLGQSDGPAAVDRLTELLVAGWHTEHAKRFVGHVDAIAKVGGARAVEVLLRSSGERRDGKVNEFRELSRSWLRVTRSSIRGNHWRTSEAPRDCAQSPQPEALLRLVEQRFSFIRTCYFLCRRSARAVPTVNDCGPWSGSGAGGTGPTDRPQVKLQVTCGIFGVPRRRQGGKSIRECICRGAAGRVGDYDAMHGWCREGLHGVD